MPTTAQTATAPSPLMNNNNRISNTSQQQGPATAMPEPSGNNIYSLKNKGKTNYYAKLDVMGNSTKKIENSDINPLLSNVAPPAALPSNFYIPQQIASNESKFKINNRILSTHLIISFARLQQ